MPKISMHINMHTCSGCYKDILEETLSMSVSVVHLAYGYHYACELQYIMSARANAPSGRTKLCEEKKSS